VVPASGLAKNTRNSNNLLTSVVPAQQGLVMLAALINARVNSKFNKASQLHILFLSAPKKKFKFT